VPAAAAAAAPLAGELRLTLTLTQATDVFVCDAPSFQCLLPLLRRSQVSSG
jgi:hypothetical protein